MKKIGVFFSVASIVILVSGCGVTRVQNSGFTGEHQGPGVTYDSPLIMGCIISDFTHPQTIRGSQSELGSKQGKATASSVLWAVAKGDNSVATAAKNGGITKIKTADVHVNSMLFGAYTEITTIVTGE